MANSKKTPKKPDLTEGFGSRMADYAPVITKKKEKQ
jgi:hypothetical protein